MAGLLEGKVAFVTGGAGGIGAAIAERLGKEDASVAVADISLQGAQATAQRIQDAGGKAKAYSVDVSSGEAVKAAFSSVESDLGIVELVATAAGVIDIYDFVDLSEASWDRTININLKGTFLVFQEAARRLLAAERTGSFVAISSVAGRGGRKNAVDYAASKAGVISVVRSAMLAFSPHGITVNAVCPGIVDTPMTRKIHEERAPLAGITPEESFNRIKATIPLGKVQTPDDVADVVTFLLSPQGSYITGQAINACGGLEQD